VTSKPTPPSNDGTPVAAASLPARPAETGWLPDLLYVGGKFESGLAFFADAAGRITRLSREPADLASARRLSGQAALPGLVNAHSHAFHRVLRGQAPGAAWHEAHARAAARLSAEDAFDAARMAFLEMLLSGITCVGEFNFLVRSASEVPAGEETVPQAILQAGHDVGIRIALLNVAWAHPEGGAAPAAGEARFVTRDAEQFVRETEALRAFVEKKYFADDAWVGVAVHSLGAVPLDYLKAVARHAHARRLRFHLHVAATAAEVDACRAQHGRTPVALLADLGAVDKRLTAVHAGAITDDEIKLLGAARAVVCACPTSERWLGLAPAPVERLLAAGAAVALGSDSHREIDLLDEARSLEDPRRRDSREGGANRIDAAGRLHAATVAGARSLGATGGAIEVGRPADFFTVNLFDPSLAGADAETLPEHVVHSLQRRAIRDVWIGGRPRIAGGRHANQGPIVGRFVDLQRRLWGAG
jgi:formimidoylglutamate deiminase